MNDDIEKLSELFMKFPGIGKRQSRRFVYSLLHKSDSYISDLIENIKKLKQNIHQCSKCFRFTSEQKNSVCSICNQGDLTSLLIVEKDADLEKIHATGIYKGQYFVLGGFISSYDKKPSFAKVDQLIARINEGVSSGILQEVIFGMSISPEAEHTRFILNNKIRELSSKISITTLGRGLSTGVELEYSDSETLKHALGNRI